MIRAVKTTATPPAARKQAPPTHERIVLGLAARRPLLRARDVAEHGVPTVVLTRLVADGQLVRVARGLYALPDRSMSANRSLAEVALRVPRGVVCLLSALRVHDIGTQSPPEVWLAIPRSMVPPRLDQPHLRVIRMSDASLAAGVRRIDAEGVRVPVFDVAKTVADCFKYRSRVGLDVALEALREARRERKATMDELWHYAKIDRVANVMRPYLESLAA